MYLETYAHLPCMLWPQMTGFFTNSECTNPRFFFLSCFLLKELQSIFFKKINCFSYIFDLNRQSLLYFEKENKKMFVKKILVDS